MVLEKTLESPWDCKEIQPVHSKGDHLEGKEGAEQEKKKSQGRASTQCLYYHPKGDQSWVFIGRTDAEAETPILWPPHVKS